MHALHGNTSQSQPDSQLGRRGRQDDGDDDGLRRSSRARRPPVDVGDVQAQLTWARSERTRPLDVVRTDGRATGRLTWGHGQLTWDGSDIVPQEVQATDTVSYIICPLIADVIGMSHWFPDEVCPRPQHLGTILVHYRPDDMIHPGGSGFVLTYDGPSWGHVVETLRHRFELQGLDTDEVIARMDGRLSLIHISEPTRPY